MEEKPDVKKTIWKTTDNRFVAFLDLLGFKDKVMRKSHAEIYEELNTISVKRRKIEDVISRRGTDTYFIDSDVYIVNFSDSIVMFSKNDSYRNFEFFLLSLRYLFSNILNECIAVKGGIAHGQVSVNKKEQIYFGQPIIDAYLIEEDVNYLGVTCHHSIDSYISKNTENVNNSKIIDQLLFESVTPLKSGKIHHYNLDWFFMCVKEKRGKTKSQVEVIVLERLKSFYLGVSGNPRRYIDNTIELFENNMSKGIINITQLKFQ